MPDNHDETEGPAPPSWPLRIATRRSPLAVAQAEGVRARLAAAHGVAAADLAGAMPILTFQTTGDRQQQGSLAEIGGKGLFVKEIELALLTRAADIAVHSMKDLPAEMPDGLTTAAVPPRDDPRDAFVTVDGRGLFDLAAGSVIGTSSVRRAAQLKRRRPDLTVAPMRGNVQTRLRKLGEGRADGTFLAEAGLVRLGRDDVRRHVLDPDVMLPALGQGALCVQARADDAGAMAACAAINCMVSELATAAERAFVAVLDGSCRTPMAGLAVMRGERLVFEAQVLTLDGGRSMRRTRRVALGGREHDALLLDAIAAGAEAGQAIADEAGPQLLGMLGR